MTAAQARRTFGLSAGTLLIFFGILGIWISKADYEKPLVRKFCDAGFCPEEFTPERVFQLSQKATLGDANGQLHDFQRALVADSASAYRWADLADAEFHVHDLAKAKYAYERALGAGPRSAVILMRAANFFFEAGDNAAVVRNLRQILRDPELWMYLDTVFLTYSRLGIPVDQLLETGVPPTTTAGSHFLLFWIKTGKEPEANQTWNWLLSKGLADDATAGAYTEFLLEKKDIFLAQKIWKDYMQREMPQYCETNWIFNGNFEEAFKPSPFDWKIVPNPEVDVERFSSQAAHGRWSIELAFHANDNVDYRQTYQSVVLRPGKWRFSAKVKIQDITTDQGLQFHLVDLHDSKNLDVRTTPENGTLDWHRVTREFNVQPGTGVIRIEIARQQSLRFDNRITGTAWVDELNLSPIK